MLAPDPEPLRRVRLCPARSDKQRDVDSEGYDFWLNVLNNREPDNYHGMVCSFITSVEYQRRFASVVTHSNAECGR
jgi:hypothetical protein